MHNKLSLLRFFGSRILSNRFGMGYTYDKKIPTIISLLLGGILVTVLLGAPSVHAENVYILADAVGANNGTDWKNAYTLLPNTLIRGNTYYIADGVYGSYTFDDAVSGASFILIKKATVTDHGMSTGWQDSYGDGVASFTSWVFTTGYYEINGQVGQWASDLPGYQAYGFKVQQTATVSNTKLIKFSSDSVSNIIIKHVEASFSNTPLTGIWSTGMDIVYGYGSNLNFEYCWFHDGGRCVAIPVGADYVTFDHCVLERNGQAQRAMGWSPAEHSELVMFQPDADYGVIRYSHIRDWRSTGGVILYTENDHMEFYGNVFSQTGDYTDSNANGALNGLSAATNLDAVAYNNTFVDLRYGCSVLSTATSWVSRTVKNNIFYNCNRGGTTAANIGGTHDYNLFYNSGAQSEPHIQNGTGDPFVNRSNKNYRLTQPTVASDSVIGIEYKIDLTGVSRGSDGVWDRGAVEYENLGAKIPFSPSGIIIGN